MAKQATVYCPECGSRQKYFTTNTLETITVRGKEITYREKTAICEVCGTEVYVAKISDENARARNNAYRRG